MRFGSPGALVDQARAARGPGMRAPQPRGRGARAPISRPRFGLAPFRSPLLGGSRLDFPSSGYLDVSVPPVASGNAPGSRPSPAGFPHSGTPGSKAACASPGNIAACRALRRPPVPRHPPRALVYHAPPLAGGAGAGLSCARERDSEDQIPRTLSISLSRRYAALKVPGEGPGGRTPSRLFLGGAGAGASVMK